MTDHPILFQPAMIKALLAGCKTQTRRLVSAHNTTFDSGPWPDKSLDLSGAWLDKSFPTSPILKVLMANQTNARLRPRVRIGDRLWVKEAHFALGHWVEKGELKKNGQPKMMFVQHPSEPVRFVEPDHTLRFPRDTTFGWYPRNSLFMCRKDCRMVLPVTNVRFQRLQDISESNAVKEGIEDVSDECPAAKRPAYRNYERCGSYAGKFAASSSFRSLITSINGPEAWVENRWSVAYTFEVV